MLVSVRASPVPVYCRESEFKFILVYEPVLVPVRASPMPPGRVRRKARRKERKKERKQTTQDRAPPRARAL